jgi:hypothetical protein
MSCSYLCSARHSRVQRSNTARSSAEPEGKAALVHSIYLANTEATVWLSARAMSRLWNSAISNSYRTQLPSGSSAEVSRTAASSLLCRASKDAETAPGHTRHTHSLCCCSSLRSPALVLLLRRPSARRPRFSGMKFSFVSSQATGLGAAGLEGASPAGMCKLEAFSHLCARNISGTTATPRPLA